MIAEQTPTPDHIPLTLVRDVDIYNPSKGADQRNAFLAWKSIQDTHPPIFWTPRQGGHWVVTRYKDIKHVAETHQDFSSRENFIPRGVAPAQLPMNLDPPEHTPVRRLLVPSMMPKQLKLLEVKVRASTIALIDEIYPQGECEFIEAFANVMPVKTFLSLMGLPEADHLLVNQIGADITKINEPAVYMAAKERLTEYMLHWIGVFRTSAGPGLISDIIHSDASGLKFSDADVENICVLLMAAGIDTVKSALAFMANLLAGSHTHRRQLIDDPALIPNAVEETLRRFGSSNLARVVRRDIIYEGISFRAGDMVLIPFPLAGLDETENLDPMTVDFTRRPLRHLNFGAGPHVCVGQALARQEIIIFVEEWLKRIPDFRLKPKTTMSCATGLANIPLTLYLEWDRF